MKKKTCLKCCSVFFTEGKFKICLGCRTPAKTPKKKRCKRKRFHVDLSTGNKYRSKFEVEIANFFKQQQIAFEYEVNYVLPTGFKYKRKLVDFRTDEYLIEATGLRRDQTASKFVAKITLLKQVADRKILVIAYNESIKAKILFQLGLSNIIVVCLDEFKELFKSD